MDSTLQKDCASTVESFFLPPLLGTPVCNGHNVATETHLANQNCPVTYLDSISRHGDSGIHNGDGEVGTADDTSPSYVSSPAKKFPARQPMIVAGMTNQDPASYENGYDSDGQLPCFDVIADGGDDPDTYNENPILITALLKESTTLPDVKASKEPTLSVEDAQRLKVNQIKHVFKKRGLKVTAKKGGFGIFVS